MWVGRGRVGVACCRVRGVRLGLLGVMLATPLVAVLLVFIKMLYVEDVLEEPMEVAGAVVSPKERDLDERHHQQHLPPSPALGTAT